jgi:hypothetical protein
MKQAEREKKEEGKTTKTNNEEKERGIRYRKREA